MASKPGLPRDQRLIELGWMPGEPQLEGHQTVLYAYMWEGKYGFGRTNVSVKFVDGAPQYASGTLRETDIVIGWSLTPQLPS